MRILMVTNNWVPYAGGVVNSLATTIDLLHARGHEVTIVTLDFVGNYHDPSYVYRMPSIMRYNYKKNPIAIPWFPQKYLLQIIQKIKPDVIHIHHPFLLGAMALKSARKNKIPVVFTYHSLYEKYVHYVWPIPQFIMSPIVRYLSMRCASSVDYVIAPSCFVATYIKKNMVNTKMSVLPSAIPACYFSKVTDKKIILPIKLLYVGRFVPEKNLHFLFDAIAQLQCPYQFTLVGYGYAQRDLEQYAFSFCGLLPQQVHFVVNPSKQEIIKYYQDAHLKLFASQTETQGLVLAEAMASGTPVIALSGSGVDDIVESAINGYRVENVQEMVLRIMDIVGNPQLYATLCYGARKTAQRYAEVIIGDQLEDIYNAITKKE